MSDHDTDRYDRPFCEADWETSRARRAVPDGGDSTHDDDLPRRDDGGEEETVAIPADALADHLRSQMLLDADVSVSGDTHFGFNVWDAIRGAECEDIRYASGRVWGDFRATYHGDEVLIAVEWSFDPEEQPTVDIQVA